MFSNPLLQQADTFLVIAMLIPALFTCFFILLAWLSKQLFVKRSLHLFAAISCTVALCITYGTFIEPNSITITEVAVPFPTTENIKVALIADMHKGGFTKPGHLERVVNTMNTLELDAILIAGDFLDGLQYSPTLLEPLQRLETKYGAYGVLGNHDMVVYPEHEHAINTGQQIEDLVTALQSYGISILRQGTTTINIPNNPITVGGIDDLVVGRGNPTLAFAGTDNKSPTILISHNPSVVKYLDNLKVDLVVAGHTHGGQIALPFIGPISKLPTSLGQKFDQGLFTWNETTQLAITRGLGETFLRLRFWLPPEIMVLNLIPKE